MKFDEITFFVDETNPITCSIRKSWAPHPYSVRINNGDEFNYGGILIFFKDLRDLIGLKNDIIAEYERIIKEEA